jgi:hypothetical protein
MTGPLILIVLGILFLLNNLYPEMFSFGRLWPVILIVIGLGKIFDHLVRREKRESGTGAEAGEARHERSE